MQNNRMHCTHVSYLMKYMHEVLIYYYYYTSEINCFYSVGNIIIGVQ